MKPSNYYPVYYNFHGHQFQQNMNILYLDFDKFYVNTISLIAARFKFKFPLNSSAIQISHEGKIVSKDNYKYDQNFF